MHCRTSLRTQNSHGKSLCCSVVHGLAICKPSAITQAWVADSFGLRSQHVISLGELFDATAKGGRGVPLLVIGCLQDAKLVRLEASLQQREEQIENHHAERIRALKSRRSREVQQKLAYVHRYAHLALDLQMQLLVCSALSVRKSMGLKCM